MYIVNSQDIKRLEELIRPLFNTFDYEVNQISLLQNSHKQKVTDFALFFYKKFLSSFLKKLSVKYYCDIIVEDSLKIQISNKEYLEIKNKDILNGFFSDKRSGKIFFGNGNDLSENKKLRVLLYINGFDNFINSIPGISLTLMFESFDEKESKWINRGFLVADMNSKEFFHSESSGIFCLNGIKTGFSPENDPKKSNIGIFDQNSIYELIDLKKKVDLDFNYIIQQNNPSLTFMHFLSGRSSSIFIQKNQKNQILIKNLIEIAYSFGAKFINLSEKKEIKNKDEIFEYIEKKPILITNTNIFKSFI